MNKSEIRLILATVCQVTIVVAAGTTYSMGLIQDAVACIACAVACLWWAGSIN